MADSIPPLFNPAGAYHSYDTLSLKAITPPITVEDGTQRY
jgi:hypothetical protein